MADTTLLDLLASRFEARGDEPYARFLTQGEVDGPVDAWSWSDLDRATSAVAVALRERCQPGDRALVVCPAGLNFVAAFLGCLRAGVVAVPVAPPVPVWRQRNLGAVRSVVQDAQPTAVLTTTELMADLTEVHAHAKELAELPWLAVDDLPPAVAPAFSVSPDDVAFLQYTSGSTGRPKGVVVRHGNLMANQEVIYDGFGHEHGSTTGVCWLPLFHDMGLIGSVVQPIFFDAPLMTFLTPTQFLRKPVRWLKAISSQKNVTSGGPNFAFELCCDRISDKQLEGLDLSEWRVAYSGAEPVQPRTLDRFAERFGPVGFKKEAFLPCYGLAEATLMVSGKRATPLPHRVSLTADSAGLATATDIGMERVSCGLPAEGHEVQIVDPATMLPVQAGKAGAIWVRGPSVSTGYWKLPPFNSHLATGEGPFFDTGDLGLFDKNGGVVVTGREKDLLIVRGRNVHPADVEDTVKVLNPEIRQGGVAVFSVPGPAGDQVVICVELRGTGHEAFLNEVRAEVVLQHSFTPDVVAAVERGALPKTSSGKIRRSTCREDWVAGRLMGQPAPSASAPEAAPTAVDVEESGRLLAMLLTWMKVHAGIAHPRADQTFVEQGLDSLKLAALSGELEGQLGLEVPVERFYAVSPSELADGLSGGQITLADAERVDLAADVPLDPTIQPQPGSLEGRWPVLLVTGVTGFLGAFLLSELLLQTDADLLCLVRASDPEAGLERVRANLKQFGLWSDAHARRLRIEVGDLSEPRLGLSDVRWTRIASQITGIYHCGAHVHWGMPYSQLREANVTSSTDLVRLAFEAGGAHYHFISSLGVFPVGISPRDHFGEDDALLDGENLDLGYFQTKWVAERRLQQARERGLPVTIYRPGFIGGCSTNGKSTPGQRQLFAAFLAGSLRMGVAPDVDKVMDIVPVDDVARCIVGLALHGDEPAWNLLQRTPLQQRDLYNHLRSRGYSLRTEAYSRWRTRLLELEPSDANPLTAYQGYYRLQTPARMRRIQVLLRDAVPIAQTRTRAALDALGLDITPLDASLVDVYVDALVASGEAPSSTERVGQGRTGPVIELVDYDVKLPTVRSLYDRATAKQWRSDDRLDWGIATDPDNPLALPEHAQPLFGSDLFRKMNPEERMELRCHVQAWQLSQFLHGEQGALLCASQIVQHAPTLEARLFAGTQVMDEARHVEVFDRLLSERFDVRYPITPPLKRLLDDVLTDNRWDMTYLGMQVLIEGLALASFAQIRDQSSNQLAIALNAYVMQDEARHVAFGRLVLADYYPQLTQAERDEREEFVVEATYLLRDRFDPTQVWEQLGLPVAECAAYLRESGLMAQYRRSLFSRIVPTVRAIQLWGPRVQKSYEQMGLLSFANVDLEALHAEDERLATNLEAK